MDANEAKALCWDAGRYPAFFDVTMGAGFHLSTRPELYCRINTPRKVKIRITSFRGFSCFARHYYATIHADGIDICRDEQTEKGVKTWRLGGYLCEEFNELPADEQAIYGPEYRIEVCRKVTFRDIQDDPLRWEGYNEGSLTPAFDSPEEAVEQAKKIVKARFSTEWQLDVEQ